MCFFGGFGGGMLGRDALIRLLNHHEQSVILYSLGLRVCMCKLNTYNEVNTIPTGDLKINVYLLLKNNNLETIKM